MRKRIRVAKLVSLGIVFAFTLSVLVGCGGVSVKVIEKQKILGAEFVTAYVSGFKNDDATWKKLEEFGNNFDKNIDEVTIYFFNDKSKIPSLKSLEGMFIDSSTDGVVGMYVRYEKGEGGSIIKNPEFKESAPNSTTSEKQGNSEASNSEEKSNPETEKPQPAPKVEIIPVTWTASSDEMGLEITVTSITLSTDPISGEQTVTVTAVAKNISDQKVNVPSFWLFDEKYHNKFSANDVSADVSPIPVGAKTRIVFSVKLPNYVSINNVDLGCSDWWRSMWDKLTPAPADLGTPIFTATGDYGFLSIYEVTTVPQDDKNKLDDESKQYLMIEVEVNQTNDSYYAVSKDNFSLIDKEEFAYPQVTHDPQHMTSGSAKLWRGQLFFAVPKGSPSSNYSLIFNTSSWSQKAKTVVDLSKLTTR